VTQIGSRVVEQANSFARSMPGLLARWQQPSAAASPAVNSFKAQVIAKVQEQFGKSSGDIIAALPRAGFKILSVASDLIYVVIVPILGFFFLKDGRGLVSQFVEMFDEGPWRSMIDETLADVNLLLAHYMRAILLLSMATFASYSIFFSILGIPYSILLAALAGTLEFIPMIGEVASGLVILIVTGVSGGPFWARSPF